MRYIAIDYGSKRTGVANSDEQAKVALVKETISASIQLEVIKRIKDIVNEEQLDAIIVGVPVKMSGAESEMTNEVQLFIAKLRDHFTVPVQTYDERLTTEMAKKLLRGVKNEERDQVAAQIMLQNFLDELAVQ